jgi:hypothetical protein
MPRPLAPPACERKVSTPGPDAGPPAAEAPAAAQGAELGRPLEVKLGQAVRVGPDRLEVTFAAVPEDSRCPEGVQCVWAGRAAVDLKMAAPGAKSAEVRLTTERGSEEASYGRYTVRLVSLEPHPRQNVPIRPAEYAATIVVSGT